jgi:predicted RNA-binding Zn-ribbon protein involved in translation (DUF1610 family)
MRTQKGAKKMKQSHCVIFKVDITQIEGEGNFSCPKCGVTISPDDETETVYKIIDTKVKKQNLEELTILCNKCESKIRLVGFLQIEK